MANYTIIGHAKATAQTEAKDFVFEFEAAYHTDAMAKAKQAMLAEGFKHGNFTVEFLTDAEAATYLRTAA